MGVGFWLVTQEVFLHWMDIDIHMIYIYIYHDISPCGPIFLMGNFIVSFIFCKPFTV